MALMIVDKNALYDLEFAGSARPNNPGPAGAAAIIRLNGEVVEENVRGLGMSTSNEAEYAALIVGLQTAAHMGIERLRICGDSQLVVNQVLKKFEVKKEHLRPLRDEVRHLFRFFNKETLTWIKKDETSKGIHELAREGCHKPRSQLFLWSLCEEEEEQHGQQVNPRGLEEVQAAFAGLAY